MNYSETQQKMILREIEKDLLAIVAVDMQTSGYEVIYSDGAYKEFGNRHGDPDFFLVWKEEGLGKEYTYQVKERIPKGINYRMLYRYLPFPKGS